MAVLSLACDIMSDPKNPTIVWVRNGAKILTAPAAIIAAMGRKGTL